VLAMLFWAKKGWWNPHLILLLGWCP